MLQVVAISYLLLVMSSVTSSPSIFPWSAFRAYAKLWTDARTRNQGKLAATAALRDCQALLASAPRGLRDILPADSEHADTVRMSIEDTVQFVNDELLSLFRHRASRSLVASPYAGGVNFSDFDESVVASGPASVADDVVVGVLNPGRLGLSTLGTDQVLWWRLWSIAWAAMDLKLRILILPGVRLPTGCACLMVFLFT